MAGRAPSANISPGIWKYSAVLTSFPTSSFPSFPSRLPPDLWNRKAKWRWWGKEAEATETNHCLNPDRPGRSHRVHTPTVLGQEAVWFKIFFMTALSSTSYPNLSPSLNAACFRHGPVPTYLLLKNTLHYLTQATIEKSSLIRVAFLNGPTERRSHGPTPLCLNKQTK